MSIERGIAELLRGIISSSSNTYPDFADPKVRLSNAGIDPTLPEKVVDLAEYRAKRAGSIPTARVFLDPELPDDPSA